MEGELSGQGEWRRLRPVCIMYIYIYIYTHSHSCVLLLGAWPSAPSQADEEQEEEELPSSSPLPNATAASPFLPSAVCVPAPRWGHSTTAVRPYDRMLVFGGVGDDDAQTYGDLFVYECGERPVDRKDTHTTLI